MGSTEQRTHPYAQHYSRDGSWHSSEPRMVMGDLGDTRLLPSTQVWGAEGSGTCRRGSEVMSSGRSPLSSLGLAACSLWLLTAWESFCLPHLALGCAHLHRGVPRVALGSGNIQLGQRLARPPYHCCMGEEQLSHRPGGTWPSLTAQAPTPTPALPVSPPELSYGRCSGKPTQLLSAAAQASRVLSASLSHSCCHHSG